MTDTTAWNPRAGRGFTIFLVFLLAAGSVTGCQLHWKPPPTRSFGVRITDGHLDIWTLSPCRDVQVMEFEMPSSEYWESVDPAGTDVEYVRVGGPYSGFRLRQAARGEQDWSRAESIWFAVTIGGKSFGGRAPLTEAVEHSSQHPGNVYYVSNVGWLDPAEAAARNGKDFLGLCAEA